MSRQTRISFMQTLVSSLAFKHIKVVFYLLLFSIMLLLTMTYTSVFNVCVEMKLFQITKIDDTNFKSYAFFFDWGASDVLEGFFCKCVF